MAAITTAVVGTALAVKGQQDAKKAQQKAADGIKSANIQSAKQLAEAERTIGQLAMENDLLGKASRRCCLRAGRGCPWGQARPTWRRRSMPSHCAIRRLGLLHRGHRLLRPGTAGLVIHAALPRHGRVLGVGFDDARVDVFLLGVVASGTLFVSRGESRASGKRDESFGDFVRDD